MWGSSDTVVCCPAALQCPIFSAVAAALACSPPAPIWISNAFSMAKEQPFAYVFIYLFLLMKVLCPSLLANKNFQKYFRFGLSILCQI